MSSSSGTKASLRRRRGEWQGLEIAKRYAKSLSGNMKIHAAFVQSMPQERASRKIVEAIVDLGHSLALTVIAEGIETEDQAGLLRRAGCPFAQEYLFGRPMPIQEWRGWLVKS